VVSKLEENGLKCKREPSAEDAAISVTFDESKGLEAEFVVVIDMEHLRKTTNNPFEEVTPEQRRELDEFARCRAYVAMTRAKRNLTWVYYDRNDPLVRDLIKPYRKVMAAYAK
jgi:superfamily I DNA/RNA helicase